MASNFKRKLRAYTRRKKQRKAGKTRKTRQIQQNSSRRATLENVLGITTAQGYNENVLRQATALSKSARSNLLTRLFTKKKVNYAKRMWEKKITGLPAHSPLLAAILENAPVERIEEILKTKYVDLEDQDVFTNTALEIVLSDLRPDFESYLPSEELRERVYQLIDLLLKRGAKIRKQSLYIIWLLHWEDLIYLLDNYREFRHRTVVYKHDIVKHFRGLQGAIREEIREYQMNNFEAYVPQRLYEEFDELEERIQALWIFVETYNPNTGAYLLEPPQNNNFEEAPENEPVGEDFLNE